MNDNTTMPKSQIDEVFPYLCVRGGSDAIDFYTRAFGGEGAFPTHRARRANRACATQIGASNADARR